MRTSTPVAGVRFIGASAFSGPSASSRNAGTPVSRRPTPASTTTARKTAAAAAIAAAVRTGEEPRKTAAGSTSVEPVSVGRMGGMGVIGSLAREKVLVVERIGAGGRPAAAIRYENGMSWAPGTRPGERGLPRGEENPQSRS